MSDSAASEAREAKSEHQALKDFLKNADHDPWDKAVEFQRKALRKRYLKLLLLHPYAPESKDCDTKLWMETSYQLISSYKKRITTLDRAIESNTAPRGDSPSSTPGPVEYRKLIQRFRQFLAEEEKFWTKLVLRICRSFDLIEARPSLVVLGLVSNESEIDENAKEEAKHQNERNQAFPPEDPTRAPPTSEQRPGRLAILAKALICLGDIARYRELYNESGGRPKAGHEDIPSRRGRHKRGGSVGKEFHIRPRNYDKSQRCYERARFLLPSEGNPSHQLAILASYKDDQFTSVFHYYRSLCVKKPYEPASDNISKVLNRVLDEWKKKQGTESPPTPSDPPRVRINYFKEQIVALHALWRFGSDNTEALSRKLGQDICQEFNALLSDRHLPEELINTIVIMAQAAHWRLRMLRESERRITGIIPSAGSEYRILSHLLGLYRALLEVGLEQLKDLSNSDVHDGDLAQHISAVFRRTLPAVRIFSKWLRCNLQYVNKWAEGFDISKDKQRAQQKLSKRQTEIREFWEIYARFARGLSRAFPSQLLPLFDGHLAEDIDMRGFLPLKGMMDGPPGFPSESEEQPHPNHDQLMRISDLIQDTREIVGSERSPLAIYGDNFVLKGVESANAPEFLLTGHHHNNSLSHTNVASVLEVDDDQRTEATDDDPVRDAFKFIDRPESSVGAIDDDGEEIVYMRPAPTAISSAVSTLSPLVPARENISHPDASPSSPNAPLTSGKTTASDLLASIMGRGPDSAIDKISGVPPFTSSAAIGPSIWSTSNDEQSLTFGPNQGPPLRPRATSYSRREHADQVSWSTSPYLSHAPAPPPAMTPYTAAQLTDSYPSVPLANLNIGSYSQTDPTFHPAQANQMPAYDPTMVGHYGPPPSFPPSLSQSGFSHHPVPPSSASYRGFDEVYHTRAVADPSYSYQASHDRNGQLPQSTEAPRIWGNAG